MAKKRGIPDYLYLYIHSRIWESFNSKEVLIKEFTLYLHEWRIPKVLRPLIFKEMELLGLIKKKNRFVFELSPPQFNLVNYREYYEKMNLF